MNDISVQVQEDQQQPTGVMQLLSAAIANNIDPASMSKLYDLHERMAAQAAKEAFRNAMTRFQASCPSIGKDRSGYNDAYRYATLEHIADTIRQPLADVGLSYTFNASQAGDEITTTCTVHHVGGHSESSTFTAAATGGTKMMNVTQVRASALSYGRRYALTMALGLVIREEDDDGHDSSPPAAPAARTDAPVTQPRSDRVTAAQCSNLLQTWKEMLGANGITPTEEMWVTLVTEVTDIPADKVRHANNWKTSDLQAVAARIQVPF